MDTDVFDDDDCHIDNSLNHAQREFDRLQQSIVNSAFHHGFEETHDPTTQTGFDAAYSIAFPVAIAFGTLQNILDFPSKDAELKNTLKRSLHELNRECLTTIRELKQDEAASKTFKLEPRLESRFLKIRDEALENIDDEWRAVVRESLDNLKLC